MIVNLLPSSSDEECEITNESKDSSVSFEIVSLEADAIKESSSVQSCFASQPSASQELKFGEPNDEKKFRLTGIDDLDLGIDY